MIPCAAKLAPGQGGCRWTTEAPTGHLLLLGPFNFRADPHSEGRFLLDTPALPACLLIHSIYLGLADSWASELVKLSLFQIFSILRPLGTVIHRAATTRHRAVKSFCCFIWQVPGNTAQETTSGMSLQKIFETGSHYVAQAGLEVIILLPQPPGQVELRHVPPTWLEGFSLTWRSRSYQGPVSGRRDSAISWEDETTLGSCGHKSWLTAFSTFQLISVVPGGFQTSCLKGESYPCLWLWICQRLVFLSQEMKELCSGSIKILLTQLILDSY